MKRNKGTMKYLFSEDIQYVRGQKRQQRRLRTAVLVLIPVLVLVFSAGTLAVTGQIYEEMFGRAEKPEYTIYQTYEDVSGDYGRTEVEFYSEGNRLQGYLYGPSKNPKGIVVISHGIGGGADSYLQEAVYFAKRGYRVLSFSNTGSHESEGEGTMGLSQSVIDLDAALDYIESDEQFEKLPVLLYGHSWGGYAVTAILNYDHEIAAAVSVAGYNSPMEMIMEWTKPMMGIVRYPAYPYIWMYNKVLFGAASNLSAAKGISSVDTPVLVIHGKEDEVISCDGASIMAHRDEISNPNAVFLTWDEAGKCGHNNLFMSQEAADYAAELEKQMELMRREYGSEEEIPQDVLRGWYSLVDRRQASQLDATFMQNAYQFFENAVEK